MKIYRRLSCLLLVMTVLSASLPNAAADNEYVLVQSEAVDLDASPGTGEPEQSTDEPTEEPSSSTESDSDTTVDLCQHQLSSDTCPICCISHLIASLPESFDMEDLDSVIATLERISDIWPELDDDALVFIDLDRYAAAIDRVAELQEQASLSADSLEDSVSYIDENNAVCSVTDYILVDETCQDTIWGYTGGEHWYVVVGNVSLGDLQLHSDTVNIIITDGSSLSLGTLSSYRNLNIYGQSGGSGTLIANSIQASSIAIANCSVTAISSSSDGYTSAVALSFADLTICNATVYASSEQNNAISGHGQILIESSTVTAIGGSSYYCGIFSNNHITIVDSNVTASGGDCGISASQSLTVEGSTVNATGRTGAGLFSNGPVTISNSAHHTSTVNSTGEMGIKSYKQISITGGNVSAVSTTGDYGLGPSASDISGGLVLVTGTMQYLTTGTNGNATVFADALQNPYNTDQWSGNIYIGNPVVVNSGETLYIPEELNFDRSIVNKGEVYIDGNFTGEITGNAPYYRLKLIGCSSLTELATYKDGTYAQSGTEITLDSSSGSAWITDDEETVVTNGSFIMPPHQLSVTVATDNEFFIYIPQGVTLEPSPLSDDLALEGSLVVEADVIRLPDGKNLYLQISSRNNYNLVFDSNSDYSIPYNIASALGSSDEPICIDSGKSSVTFSLSSDTEPGYAGTYSDTLIFTFSIH